MSDQAHSEQSGTLYDRVALLAKYGFRGFERDERLAVCHRCEQIGSVRQAEDHQRSTGHPVEVLDQNVADAIRVEWSRS